MTNPLIIREDRGPVRLLLMNRPPSNSLNLALLEALSQEIESAVADAQIHCVVIGSTLPKYFSSGMDLEEIVSLAEEKWPGHFQKLMMLHRRIASQPKPTIAAIEGYALLGGFVLALGCDLRYIAQDSGRIALSEVRLGLTPTTPLLRLVFAMSGKPGLVKDLVMRGKTLRAPEALDAGLVDGVLPNEGFLDETLRTAGQLAKLPPNALASIKRDVRASFLPNEEELWMRASREVEGIFSGDEAREGILAMKEKRKPRWE